MPQSWGRLSISTFSQVGYLALAGLVVGESAGIPMPGSTALVAAGVAAAAGKLNIVLVCAIGLSLTIVGANIGYAVGRRWGTKVLSQPGPLAVYRQRALHHGIPLAKRYGPLTAFISRFVPVLKETGVLLVASFGMTWRQFVLWNSAGGVVWVLSHALLGYFLGATLGVSKSFIVLGVAEVILVATAITVRYLRRRAASRALAPAPEFDG